MNIHPKKGSPVSSRCFSEGKNSASPSDEGLQAFQSLRRHAKVNGLQGISLAEINEIIAKSRTGKGS